MPQKPIMPNPYMTTVDATEPITFSCEIDNRDTIVDYKVNISKLANNIHSDNISKKVVLPPFFAGMLSLEDACKNRVSFYKTSKDSKMYTMIVTQTNHLQITSVTSANRQRYESDNSINGGMDFDEIGISRDSIEKIIMIANPIPRSDKDEMIDPIIPGYYFKNFFNVKSIEIVGEIYSPKLALVPLSIYKNAFYGCNSLEEFEIPNNLGDNSVSPEAFNNMANLRKLTISHLALFYDPDETSYAVFPDIEEYVVRKIKKDGSSTEIPKYAFRNKNNLLKISFLEDAIDVGYGAFKGCLNLKEVNGSFNRIDTSAFEGCASLKSFFKQFSNITSVGTYAFKNSGLSKLIITDSMESLSLAAFNNCLNFASIEVTGINESLRVLSYLEANDSFLDVYADINITTTELWEKLLFGRQNKVRLLSLYDAENYTPVPVCGNKDTLSYLVDKNILQNNCEYCWSIELIDSYGETYLSPNYYFKTRKSANIEIIPPYQEITEEINVENSEKIDSLVVSQLISEKKPYFVNYFPNTSLYNNNSDVMIGTFVDESEIKQNVFEASAYNNNSFTLNYLPLQNLDGEYYINACLPYTITEEIVDENGKTKTEKITTEKWITIYLKTPENPQKAGVNTPVSYLVDRFSENVDDLTNEANYYVLYNTPFVGYGKYSVTYFVESDIKSYKHTFVAMVDTDSSDIVVPIKCSRWTLYQINNGQEILVDDSGRIYSPQLEYTFSRFLPNSIYRLQVEVENDEGVITNTAREFSTTDYSVDMEYVPEIRIDEKQNSIKISLIDASKFHTIIREDIERNEYKLIAENIPGEQKVYDFTAASNTAYKYIVYTTDSSESISVWKSDIICPHWCKVSVIGFNGSFTNKVPVEIVDEDIWCFGLNVSNIEYQQNFSKTINIGMGSQYPHITSGNTNYGKFNISALIGEVDNASGKYVKDTEIKIEAWEKFVANATAKLVVDTKGRVCVCDTISNSSSSKIEFSEQPTTINAELTEIASSTNVSLIMIKAGV